MDEARQVRGRVSIQILPKRDFIEIESKEKGAIGPWIFYVT